MPIHELTRDPKNPEHRFIRPESIPADQPGLVEVNIPGVRSGDGFVTLRGKDGRNLVFKFLRGKLTHAHYTDKEEEQVKEQIKAIKDEYPDLKGFADPRFKEFVRDMLEGSGKSHAAFQPITGKNLDEARKALHEALGLKMSEKPTFFDQPEVNTKEIVIDGLSGYHSVSIFVNTIINELNGMKVRSIK